MPPPATQGRSSISPQEVYAELELVAKSPQFNRSEKLQAFLRFVCETTVQGGGAEINEYLIGSKVFKRGDDYNPSEDSIVRRHAHAMRQKLQEYYSGEGSDHAVRIEMPVGRYIPTFRRREELAPEVPALPIPLPTPRTSVWPRRALWAFAAVATFSMGWIAAYVHYAGASQPTPAAREIWGPWLGNQAVLCFSNPMAAVIRHFGVTVAADPAAHSIRLRPDQERLFREKFGLATGGAMQFFPTIAQTMMGEAIAATHLASFFSRTGVSQRTMESRFLSWDNLRHENYVLLSGDTENHWVDTILSKYPFHVDIPADGSPRSIVDTAPAKGESASYRVIGTDEAREEYALISMIPGVAANRQLLVICGLNSPAAPPATEYLTSEAGMQQLLVRLRKAAPGHTGPWHFQAVVKTDVRDKVPTTSSIVVLRVL